MRQQARARTPALDRPRRQRRPVERLTAAAGQTRAHDALHHEATRDVLQLLRHILAETLETAAAVRAALAWREMCLLARQVVRQRAAPGLSSCGGDRLRNRLRRARDLLVLQPQLELLEGLRSGAEALAAQTRKLVLELLDQKVTVAQLGVPRRHLGPRGQHHRLQCGDVVRQGLRLFEHDRSLQEKTAKGKLGQESTYCT